MNETAMNETATNEIRFTLMVDEANLVLEGLGNLPFAKVYALVGKLQQQASEQLASVPTEKAQAAPVPAERAQVRTFAAAGEKADAA